MGIKTDSTPLEAPKDPDQCTVFALYQLMASPDQTEALRQRYWNGGMGYGHAKQALFELILDRFVQERRLFDYYQEHPAEVTIALTKGAEKARAVAQEVLLRVRDKIGY